MNTFHCPRTLLHFSSLYIPHSPKMPILPSFPELTTLPHALSRNSCNQTRSQQSASTLISSVQFSRSVVSDSLWPHGLQHTRHPCPSPAYGACSNSCPSSWWCHPTILSSVIPFSSCLQSFQALGSFLMSLLFISGGQSIGVSASTSVLQVNIQDWFPLGWTGWISLLSKGLSCKLGK